MVTRARSNTTLLRYTLTTVPDPVPVSGEKDQDLRLELKITAPASKSVYCNKIQVSFAHGSAADALTRTHPDDAYTGVEAASPPTYSQNWTRSSQLVDGVAVFTFSNSRKLEFTGSNTVTLVVSNLVVNETVGRVELGVTEWSGETSTGELTAKQLDPPILIDKWPSEFTFGNLRPDRIQVERGDPVILSWEASRGPAYTMYWDDQHESVTGELDWESPPLERSTGFMLLAELSSESGAPLIHVMTTMVGVSQPDLEVGSLTVYGMAKMQKAPTPITGPDAAEAKFYRAATDGTVSGYLKAASGLPASTLIGTVYREGTAEYTMRFLSDNSADQPSTDTPISLPVAAGTTVRLLLAGNTGDTLRLDWLARGAGGFDEIDPPTD